MAEKVKTKMPKFIDVGPVRYSVKIDGKSNDMAETDGLCSHHRLEIMISDRLADQQVRFTLAHEWLHAIIYSTGMTSGKNPVINEEAEEQVVSMLSYAVLDGLRRNKEFAEYILEE